MSHRPHLLFPLSGALALLLAAWLFHEDAPLRAGVAHHHVASVRELARGEFPPRHNLVPGVLPQGHYGPYLVFLGALARATGAEPLHVLHAAGLVNLLLFALALRIVAARLIDAEAAQWSVLAATLLWGPWPPPPLPWSTWGWPGTTSPADVQDLFYPQQAALVLLLFVLAIVLPADPFRPLGAKARAAWALLLAALLVASHPLSGMALGATLLALALSEAVTREAGPLRCALLVALPAAGLLLAALWPYYPVLGLLPSFTTPGFRDALPALSLAGGGASGSTVSLLDVVGPAIAGLAWCLIAAARGRPFLLIWLVVDLLFAWLPWLPIHQRLVTFVALPLQVASAGLFAAAWRRGRWGRAFVFSLLGAGALSAGVRVAWVLDREVPDLAFLERLTPPSAVVLSDELTSNAVAGLTGRKVVVAEGPDLFLMMLGHGQQRVNDVARFLSPAASNTERDEILRRWEVTHVLVDRLNLPQVPPLSYPAVYDGGGYVLYEARPKRR